MHGYSMFLAANCNHCNCETEVIHARLTSPTVLSASCNARFGANAPLMAAFNARKLSFLQGRIPNKVGHGHAREACRSALS